jgi:hypothetical protein
MTPVLPYSVMTTKRKFDEVGAMGAIDQAMSDLTEPERVRVLRWAWDKFGNAAGSPTLPAHSGRPVAESERKGGLVQADDGEDVGDFYSRAGASTEPERALVVAYWLQEIKGDDHFDAQSVNKELKHLGLGVSNITRALDDLKGRKPQLVIQTQKSGKTKQARKLYKVTGAGKQQVAKWLAGEDRE